MYFLPFGNTSSPKSLKTPCEVFPLMRPNNLSIKLSFKTSNLETKEDSKVATASLSLNLLFLSFTALLNNFLSITTPLNDGEAFNDASFTSPALYQK